MTIGIDVIQSALKLVGLPDRKCFTNLADLLRQIPELYAVEIPTGITNVTIGNTYPTAAEQNNLWVRTDNSGNFMGLYIYATGDWRQIYPLPQQLFLIYGDSANVPDGYTLAGTPQISSLELTNLKKIWTVSNLGPPVRYSVFHVTFTGF